MPGLTKNLPIFITETGWKHAEGITFDPSLPSSDTVAENFKQAFENAWNNNQIVAVTPFLLIYQEPLFDHFSFKKFASYDYYPFFQTIQDLGIKEVEIPKEIKVEPVDSRPMEFTAIFKLTHL